MFKYREYYGKLAELLQSSQKIWQVIVISTDGSSPAVSGMHLAVPLKGHPTGNIGGGDLEHTVINYIKSNRPTSRKIISYTFNTQGTVEDKSVVPTLDPVKTDMICGGSALLFIEPLFSSHRLYIIGGGHCGKALANIANLCDFQVIVIDNRAEQVEPSFFPPEVEAVLCNYDKLQEVIPFHNPVAGNKTFKSADRIYIVIMTYGHQYDEYVLEKCLGKQCCYLGMIGSKKKVKETLATLEQKGCSRQALKQVSAPVGLDIGSKTPYEIAVSVTAELIKVRNEND